MTPFPTAFYLVFTCETHIGPARWRLIHDAPIDTLDDAADVLADHWSPCDPEANADNVRVRSVDGPRVSECADDVLELLARRYAKRRDDVPLWLIDHAPAWVRDAHDAGQLRQMYQDAAE